MKAYRLETPPPAHQPGSPGLLVETDGYLLVWEVDGEIRIEGRVAADLVQRLLGEALKDAVKDRLPAFLKR